MKELFDRKPRSGNQKIGALIGIIASFLSVYLFFIIQVEPSIGLMIFYLPACLAFVSSLENKPFLMLLASLLYLPTFYFTSVKLIFIIIFILFLISVTFMNARNKKVIDSND